MKKLRVFGNASITVSTVIEVSDNATEKDILNKATRSFDGIHALCGNGGTDKLIGVDGSDDTIACDEPVTFDDWTNQI